MMNRLSWSALLLCLWCSRLNAAAPIVRTFRQTKIDPSTPKVATTSAVRSTLACSSMCALKDTCLYFDFAEATSECTLYGVELKASPASTLTVYVSDRRRVKIVFQDITALADEDYFPGGWVDVDTPTKFSIATSIEDYRWQSTGLFYFQLCYPDNFDECFYFKQKNNPFDGSAREGFELLHDPIPGATHNGQFVGLAADSISNSMSDGILGGNWFYAVGMSTKHWHNALIPGPDTTSMAYTETRKMYFYAVSE